MTEADKIFSRFPSFIQEYIYSHGWESFRAIQLEAAHAIFDTEENLLLASSTASGKTEAAFFPILTLLSEQPILDSVSVLYVAPLKSLINDQFLRMEEVMDASGIPVYHWHGDVGASHKNKLLKNPSGILQITPESMESLLIRRPNDLRRLFGNLRFIVLDEIHTMIGSDRGSQILCQLARLARFIGYHPRRIGLSATIGDTSVAADWLSAGSGRSCIAPKVPRLPIKWRLGMAHFYVEDQRELQTQKPTEENNGGQAMLDPGYEYLYDCVSESKALVFSNSREETEYVTATLRQIASARGEEDVFLIHHGNLSASLREDAEQRMKDESITRAVTCATVTMELGIDIGRLERVAQVGAPTTVSGFLQRLGRSGRRGSPPEMVMVYREATPLPNAPLPQLIPWDLLRGIAIVDLYSEERFIEPPRVKKMPLSLAFHQTISLLASEGEKTPAALAEILLSLPPLKKLPKDAYRELLVSMINNEYLELTDEKTLIIGLAGERILNNYKFYAVFQDSEDFTVRCGSEEIGTITTPPPAGDRFALAGRVWEVEDLDVARRLVFVHRVNGKMEVSWPGDGGEIHTKLLLAMRRALLSDKPYPYLSENAAVRLSDARHLAKRAGLEKKNLVSLGGQSYVLFPWLGTVSFRTLRRLLKTYAAELGISDIESQGCCYITFKAKQGAAEHIEAAICDILWNLGGDTENLVSASECPVFDKYDEFIPPELLRRAYAADRLQLHELQARYLGEERNEE